MFWNTKITCTFRMIECFKKYDGPEGPFYCAREIAVRENFSLCTRIFSGAREIFSVREFFPCAREFFLVRAKFFQWQKLFLVRNSFKKLFLVAGEDQIQVFVICILVLRLLSCWCNKKAKISLLLYPWLKYLKINSSLVASLLFVPRQGKYFGSGIIANYSILYTWSLLWSS